MDQAAGVEIKLPCRPVLIAVGNSGRHLLASRSVLPHPFERAILISRHVLERQPPPGVAHYRYWESSSQATRMALASLENDDRVTLFGTPSGRTASLTILRLTRALTARQKLYVVITSPFSWEDRTRQWRALYVRFRLTSTQNVKLAVVVTGKLEAALGDEAAIDELQQAITEDAWAKLTSTAGLVRP
jgi:hypothetical protein